MAITTFQTLHTSEHTDLQVDATVEYPATAAATLFGLTLDNSENSADSFVKVYDAASAVVLGTTVPEDIYRVKAGQKRTIGYGRAAGKSFGSGVGLAAVTTGGVSGTTAPANKVRATVFTS